VHLFPFARQTAITLASAEDPGPEISDQPADGKGDRDPEARTAQELMRDRQTSHAQREDELLTIGRRPGAGGQLRVVELFAGQHPDLKTKC
jgi:hypothetical protein